MSSEDNKPPVTTTEGGEPEPFLARWSRRKEAVQQAEAEEEKALAETPPEDDAAAAAETESEPQRVLTDEDMPDIETLTPESDVSGFFSPGVSEALRKKALRKLFHTSRFNVKDGLDDYDDDYTLLQPLGDTVPWDMKKQQERLEERRRRAAEAANDETMDEVEETEQQPDAVDADNEAEAMTDEGSDGEAETPEEPDNRA